MDNRDLEGTTQAFDLYLHSLAIPLGLDVRSATKERE